MQQLKQLMLKLLNEEGYEHFEQEIRAEERRKFAEWLDKSEKYSLSKVIQCWEDSRYNQYLTVNIDEILSEYEQMKG